jgi:hypothetical protein
MQPGEEEDDRTDFTADSEAAFVPFAPDKKFNDLVAADNAELCADVRNDQLTSPEIGYTPA